MENKFDEFVSIVEKLRSETGCPWDREQTHNSLRQPMLEECYEAAEAIDLNDMENLCEELGDLLLLVVMQSRIAEENGEFSINDVLNGICDKMIFRHPHVFGNVKVNEPGEALQIWERMKMKEKHETKLSEGILRVPNAMPSTMRAEKVLKKAIKAGMEFPEGNELFQNLEQGMNEMKNMWNKGEKEHISNCFGKLMMNMICLSLFLKLNTENSLTNATNAFINRFISAEQDRNLS